MAIFVDTINRQLTFGEHTRQLEPKVNLLLQALIKANGDIVSREQLIEQVWQGRIVGDGAINRTVSLLRQHLSALDSHNDFIITVPKAGYKLLHIKNSQLIPEQKPVVIELKNTLLKYKTHIILSLVLLTFLLVMTVWFKPQVNVKFKQAERITAQFGAEYSVSTNKIGDKLLYQHFDNETSSRQLYLLTADQNAKKLLPNKHIKNAAMSPNGQLFAMSYQNKQTCQIAFYDLKKYVTNNIQTCAPDSLARFTWHWNSQDIYFRSRENKTQPYKISRYNLKTSRKSLITLPQSHGNLLGDYLLDHHLNKNWLLVARYIDENNTQLLILNSFTGQTHFTYEIPYHVNALSWLNSEYASFAAKGDIYLINTLTGEINFEFKGGQSINSMDATQHSLFFTTLERASHVFKQNIKTGKRIAIDKNNAIAQLPKISSSGQLSYLSKKQSSFEWQLVKGNSTSTIDIDLPFEMGFDRYEWSENGRFILFTKQGAIYQIDVQNNVYQKLTDNKTGAFVANYSPNGNIIYSSNRSGQWQLWLYKAIENTHEQLTQHGGYSGRVKNNTLFFTKFNENGLWQINLATGDEQKLIVNVDIINWLNWQLIDKTIYFYRPESGIWKYAIDTAEETLVLAPSNRFLHQYAVSKDQKSIYFIERQNIEGDIYKVPFSINK
ncbi:winged helix-turn-helix domain-containing protein [Pseudoalteromonas denitrificans]|nr:winged helix-turn-helix domain-containing protein [Pseudoalteromonas denitrificans]